MMFNQYFKMISSRSPFALNILSLVFYIVLSWYFRTEEDQRNNLSIILKVTISSNRQ